MAGRAIQGGRAIKKLNGLSVPTSALPPESFITFMSCHQLLNLCDFCGLARQSRFFQA